MENQSGHVGDAEGTSEGTRISHPQPRFIPAHALVPQELAGDSVHPGPSGAQAKRQALSQHVLT